MAECDKGLVGKTNCQVDWIIHCSIFFSVAVSNFKGNIQGHFGSCQNGEKTATRINVPSKNRLTSLRAGSYEIDNVLVFSNSLHHFHFWDKICKFVICGVLWNKSIKLTFKFRMWNINFPLWLGNKYISTVLIVELNWYNEKMKIFSLSVNLSPMSVRLWQSVDQSDS